MRPLDRKLLRDLWNLKGQALAISLVIGAGVAMFIMYLSTFASLRLTQQTYYDRYRFAQVFAPLVRAPLTLVPRIEEIAGVARVQARVVVDVTLDVPGLTEPATGRLIGIPIPHEPMLNDVFLRRGRFPDVGPIGRSARERGIRALALARPRRSHRGDHQRPAPRAAHRRRRVVARVCLQHPAGGAHPR